MQQFHLIKNYYRYAVRQRIFQRSLKVSAVVGSLLMLINHGDKLFNQEVQLLDYLKICLTYLVPFCVSTHASIHSALQFNREGIHHD
ncbi:nitrate/nitrite transporter NrtS [Vibrio sp. HN007]|uniref:nitrate/nitrite transporter NrtS n=1 Tax=Vibrio iocasae TaxID=3098914 RepID=UPI0035D42807